MGPVSIHDTILTRGGGRWGDGLRCVTYMNKRGRDDDSGAKLLQHNEEEIQLVGHKLLQQDGSKHAFLVGKIVTVLALKGLVLSQTVTKRRQEGGEGERVRGVLTKAAGSEDGEEQADTQLYVVLASRHLAGCLLL